MEPLDRPVVPCRADLGLARASATREDDCSHRIQVAAQTKLEFEVGAFDFGAESLQRQFVF
jgi:hypothetical protein